MKRNTNILGYRILQNTPETWIVQYRMHSWFGYGKPKWYSVKNFDHGGSYGVRSFFSLGSAKAYMEEAKEHNNHVTTVVYEDVVVARQEKLEALTD
jgi:hypothetical protein